MSALFVTGTDTGVGKTTVACALLAAFRKLGLPVSPLKPLETGCPPDSVGSDAARLAAAAGTDPARAGLLRFAEPVCPEAAGRAEDRPIDVPALLALCRERAAEPTLIEGAGGLLVPIAPGYTMADLAADLGARVLVVARTRLGTLNHTLLTLAECRRRRLPVIGVILNRTDDVIGPEDRDNAELLAAHGGVEILGPLPYLRETPNSLSGSPSGGPSGIPSGEELAEAAMRELPIARLYQRAFG
jgi:dethiobiotin synthetase